MRQRAMRCSLSFGFFLLLAGLGAETPSVEQLETAIAAATAPETAPGSKKREELREEAIRTLGKWSPTTSADDERIATALGASLRSSDAQVRSNAAQALGQRGRREFIPQLFESIESDPYPVGSFFFSLREREVDPPVELLRRSLGAQSPKARSKAAEIIRWCKATALRADLEAILESDPAAAVRGEAAQALGSIAAPESAPVLERAARQIPPELSAIQALGECGSDAEAPMLISLLESKNAGVRSYAVRALTRIKVKKPQPVCDALAGAVGFDTPGDHVDVIFALLRHNDPRGFPRLRWAIEKHVIPWERKQSCVDVVRKFGGIDALPLLHEMLRLDYQRSFGLEQALEEIGHPSSGPLLWSEYLHNPLRQVVSGWCMTTAGYKKALPALAACADRDLLAHISERAEQTTETHERHALRALVGRIEARLSAHR